MESTFNEGIVAFIDILGVSQYVKIHDLSRLSFILDLGKNINYTNSKANKYNIRGFYFADTFVLVSNNIKEISQLLFVIRYIHDKAIENGFLIRGSIAKGKVYFPRINDGIFLGEAYFKAYELESKIAIYPRVLIDKSLVREVQNIDAYPLGQRDTKLCKFIKEDFDGLHYVDFLSPKISRWKQETLERHNGDFAIKFIPNNDSERFEKLVKKLCKLIKEFSNNSNIKLQQKYRYLENKLKQNKIDCCDT
ncbi:MAG: hypothetical protein DSZ30_02825 [Aquificaceae bacterium]|nr:MAG: hypothetical protein DSZ30_02825 [Aquificaceae bacterium]